MWSELWGDMTWATKWEDNDNDNGILIGNENTFKERPKRLVIIEILITFQTIDNKNLNIYKEWQGPDTGQYSCDTLCIGSKYCPGSVYIVICIGWKYLISRFSLHCDCHHLRAFLNTQIKRKRLKGEKIQLIIVLNTEIIVLNIKIIVLNMIYNCP